jgi:hypothetical protein
MKKCAAGLLCAAAVLLWPVQSYSQTRNLSLGDFSFFLSPKILKDGSITDLGFGLRYSGDWSGELRLRNTITSKNEELSGVADSLNAVNENILEVFFLPLQYTFLQTGKTRLRAEFGAYYKYDKLEEKGFFNMPELETLTPPRERVNSYTNEFSMHLGGPLAGFGFAHSIDLSGEGRPAWLGFDVDLSAGIVPVFLLGASQKMGMVPLLDPHYAEHDQTVWGAPYWYATVDVTLFKVINLALLYDFARLQYHAIDFDANLNWITAERTIAAESFKIETSLLIPLGGMKVQLGYGYTFDSLRYDDESPNRSNRHYIILTARKTGG